MVEGTTRRRAPHAATSPRRTGTVLDHDDLDFSADRLHDGIGRDALRLRYLPEVDLATGAVVAAEALVRWQHPTRGLLLPDSFIDVAESTSAITELGRWVLRNACADLSRWRSHGIGRSATLRVNVAPAELTSPDFAGTVADTLAEFGIDGPSVCLEITERAM
ncbi:EAL domain-containing protein, partial [Mycobacterium sp. M1]|nr:EAL domain-containing protein [Mycolicibacter acidiphilus]